MKLYFVLLMKSHLQSYPCPLQINSFWNLGFLLGITIILQIITGIFLGLHFLSFTICELIFILQNKIYNLVSGKLRPGALTARKPELL